MGGQSLGMNAAVDGIAVKVDGGSGSRRSQRPRLFRARLHAPRCVRYAGLNELDVAVLGRGKFNSDENAGASHVGRSSVVSDCGMGAICFNM